MAARPITAPARILAAALAGAAILALLPARATAKGPHDSVRFATFNASLTRSGEGQLVGDLSRPGNRQADAVAEIIQRTRPDVLLVNEFDFDAEGRAAQFFQENYLSRRTATPRRYTMRTATSRRPTLGSPRVTISTTTAAWAGRTTPTGSASTRGYGMAVYSRHPIDERRIRTFQSFRWKEMPDGLLPDDPATPAPADWYSREELEVFRLSSKSHWDLPVEVGNRVVHFLVSHPTPPVFDGPEDRNGRRITMRSASGLTTSLRIGRATSTTTPAGAGASRRRRGS